MTKTMAMLPQPPFEGDLHKQVRFVRDMTEQQGTPIKSILVVICVMMMCSLPFAHSTPMLFMDDAIIDPGPPMQVQQISPFSARPISTEPIRMTISMLAAALFLVVPSSLVVI